MTQTNDVMKEKNILKLNLCTFLYNFIAKIAVKESRSLKPFLTINKHFLISIQLPNFKNENKNFNYTFSLE